MLTIRLYLSPETTSSPEFNDNISLLIWQYIILDANLPAKGNQWVPLKFKKSYFLPAFPNPLGPKILSHCWRDKYVIHITCSYIKGTDLPLLLFFGVCCTYTCFYIASSSDAICLQIIFGRHKVPLFSPREWLIEDVSLWLIQMIFFWKAFRSVDA